MPERRERDAPIERCLDISTPDEDDEDGEVEEDGDGEDAAFEEEGVAVYVRYVDGRLGEG